MNNRAEQDDYAKKLERELKLHRFGILGMLSVLSILILGAKLNQSNEVSVIRAKRFEVVNDSNGIVATLSSDDGGGILEILSDESKRLIRLKAMEGIPEAGYPSFGSIAVYSADGGPLADLGSFNPLEDGGSLFIYNARGKPVYAVLAGCNGNCVSELKGDELVDFLGGPREK